MPLKKEKNSAGKVRRVYLDNAAATPVDGGVMNVMSATAKKFPGNPSALHKEGVLARQALEGARAQIANVLSAHVDEVVFTSGATEANNMAIQGVVRATRAKGVVHPHIIVSAIEHPSVLEVSRVLEKEGVRVDYLSVNSHGVADLKELRKLITPETVLVSVMYANNEVGTIEPIRDIAKEIRHARKMNNSSYPYFHTDAAQAANYLDLNVLSLGVDLMTLSSGKTYGPRGIGALFIRRGVNVAPLMYGGEHEQDRRAGTEAVALALGFAEALCVAQKMKVKEFARVQKLRDAFAKAILKKILGSTVNGNLEHALPNILNISLPGVDSEALVIYLDAAGVAVSGKSACKSSEGGASHVILAIGKGMIEQAGAIRFSLGRETMSTDITYTTKELSRIVLLLREAHLQSGGV